MCMLVNLVDVCCVCTCEHVCRGQRTTSGNFLCQPLSYSFKTGSLTEPGATLVARKLEQSSIAADPIVLGLQACIATPAFYVGAGSKLSVACLVSKSFYLLTTSPAPRYFCNKIKHTVPKSRVIKGSS